MVLRQEQKVGMNEKCFFTASKLAPAIIIGGIWKAYSYTNQPLFKNLDNKKKKKRLNLSEINS